LGVIAFFRAFKSLFHCEGLFIFVAMITFGEILNINRQNVVYLLKNACDTKAALET